MPLRSLNVQIYMLVLCCGVITAWASQTTQPKTRSTEASAAAKKPSAAFYDLARRADQAWQANKFAEAATLYRKAVDLQPAWNQGWARLSGSLFELQRYREAGDAARESTILTPKDGGAWAHLGLCEYEVRDYQRAFADLLKGEQLGLGDNRDLVAQVKYHLAILWLTAGKFENGLSEMVWFPKQNLGSPEIVEAIGLCVLHLPKFPYEIPDDQEEMVLLAGKAGYALYANNMDGARTFFEQLVSKYPRQPYVHYAYGQLLSHLDFDQALKEYEEEIVIAPTNFLARVEAAYLDLRKGDAQAALPQAQEALRLAPQYAETHNLMGRVLMELDRTTEALPELEKATQMSPNNSGFHLQLARAYQKTGATESAKKEIAAFNELEAKKAQQNQAEAPR